MKTHSKVAGIIIGGTLLALVSRPVAYAAGAPTIEFRGVPLGSTEREFVAATPGIRCSDLPVAHRALGDRSCTASDRSPGDKAVLAYAGIQASDISAYFYGDRLSSISVSLLPYQFSQVVDALKAKFGPPTSEESPPFNTLDNRGLVPNRVIVWQSGESKIKAQLYFLSDLSLISYTSAERLREKAKRDAETSKANAKGL